MKSKIYLAAWIAAEDALPESSRKLIEHHDVLHKAWREASFSGPVPVALAQASMDIDADPCAKIAFDLRKATNEAAHEEWRAAEEKEAA